MISLIHTSGICPTASVLFLTRVPYSLMRVLAFGREWESKGGCVVATTWVLSFRMAFLAVFYSLLHTESCRLLVLRGESNRLLRPGVDPPKRLWVLEAVPFRHMGSGCSFHIWLDCNSKLNCANFGTGICSIRERTQQKTDDHRNPQDRQ